MTVLKNFSTIRDSIIIDPGNFVYTSRDNSVFAWTTVEEEFDRKLPIICLSSFLKVIERFQDPDIILEDQFVLIKQGRSRIRFKYTNPAVLQFDRMPLAGKSIEEICSHVGDISKQDLDNIMKMSGDLGFEILQLVCDGGKLYLRATKEKDKEGNYFDVGLAKNTELPDFVHSVDIGRLLMLREDYAIYFQQGKCLGFKGKNTGISYVLAFNITQNRSKPQRAKQSEDK